MAKVNGNVLEFHHKSPRFLAVHISADALTVGCRRNVKPELAETNGVRAFVRR